MQNTNPIYEYSLEFRSGEVKKVLMTFDSVHAQQFVYVAEEDKTKIFTTHTPLAGEDDIKVLLSFYLFNEEAIKITTSIRGENNDKS